MTRLITNVAPSQLVLSKDGTLKVAFFDRVCKIDVKRDDKGREINSKEVAKLFIHIEIPADNSTIVERPAAERKVRNGDDTIWVHEKELFVRAYEKYLALKNEVVFDPHAEIEELKKKLAAAEASKAEVKAKPKARAKSKAEDISGLENADKETKSEE